MNERPIRQNGDTTIADEHCGIANELHRPLVRTRHTFIRWQNETRIDGQGWGGPLRGASNHRF